MAEGYVNRWTRGHFIGGIAYRLVLFPDNIIISFVLSVFFHLLIELMEQSVHPITGTRESLEDHTGDMLSFIIGWCVGCFINPYLPSYGSVSPVKNIRVWLAVIVVILTSIEFFREVVISDNKYIKLLLYPQEDKSIMFSKYLSNFFADEQ